MAEKKKKKIIPKKYDIERQNPPERIKNFYEVAFAYTPENAIKEAHRCLMCKDPKCIAGCPVEIDIPKFIQLIKEEKFIEAARNIKKYNSLPAICGRVCPQEDQCEKVCILEKKYEPVAIGRLEKFVADWERNHAEIDVPDLPKPTGKAVAVVGSGPAGLTVAGELRKMGHDVVIFEALHKAGGVLVYGIPEFRLPKKILQSEVDFVVKLGAKLEVNHVIGRIASIDELMKNGFGAVFLGTGAGLPFFMNIPGENLNGVYSANEFLTRSNLMKGFSFPEYDTPIIRGKNVSVIGAGNTAMDAARIAKRLGAENSYIIYRRSEVEMPARIEEIHHAKEEGIEFKLLTAPVEIIGTNDSWVKALRCIKMELGEPDSSGRRRPIPIKGSEYYIDMDVVIMAVSQAPNPLIQSTTPELEVTKWGTLVVNKDTMATTKKGVYAGGDIVTGGATVILAMGAGKLAARSIDQYLKSLG
ncbi:NADPH-dependent glutamate synthase [bacterium]|nr:NADPH-dependent glutamate synthase [bacterium]